MKGGILKKKTTPRVSPFAGNEAYPNYTEENILKKQGTTKIVKIIEINNKMANDSKIQKWKHESGNNKQIVEENENASKSGIYEVEDVSIQMKENKPKRSMGVSIFNNNTFNPINMKEGDDASLINF